MFVRVLQKFLIFVAACYFSALAYAQIDLSQVNNYCGEFGRAKSLAEAEQQFLSAVSVLGIPFSLYGEWINDPTSTGSSSTPDGKLCSSLTTGSVFTHLITLAGDPLPGQRQFNYIYVEFTKPNPPCDPTQACCTGNAQAGMSFGNPILPATAEKLLSKTDFSDASPHGLDFSRNYRTKWGDVLPKAGMGDYWNHRFAVQLTGATSNPASSNSRAIQHADGSQSRFTRTSSTAAWVNTDGNDTLVETTVGTVTTTLYTRAADDSKLQFNAAGKLITQTARNGWVYTLAYNVSNNATNPNQLATVTN